MDWPVRRRLAAGQIKMEPLVNLIAQLTGGLHCGLGVVDSRLEVRHVRGKPVSIYVDMSAGLAPAKLQACLDL